jgi:hypothetical protein
VNRITTDPELCGGGVGVGSDRQPPTGIPFAAIHLAEGIFRRAGMKPPFGMQALAFSLGNPSILPKDFTGILVVQETAHTA